VGPRGSRHAPEAAGRSGAWGEGLGNGAVQRAAIGALAAAERVLSVAEVQVAVEERLGMAVSRDSVRSCLSSGARGSHPIFERTGPGCYRVRRPI
jgi:hypothetical protein